MIFSEADEGSDAATDEDEKANTQPIVYTGEGVSIQGYMYYDVSYSLVPQSKLTTKLDVTSY